ncbi:phospholipase D family protein [Bacillus vallismortis]|nr:phospholipase D family protein [Bacillus vallismortis]
MLTIINQPNNGSLGHQLETLLQKEEITNLSILVAYAKKSGVIRLLGKLQLFKERGGTITIVVGIDQSNTSKDALVMLYNICDELYIYHNEKADQTYHPKLYMLNEESLTHVFIGSNNLTAGGLYTNNEVCTYSQLNLNLEQDSTNNDNLLETFTSYINTSNDLCKKVDLELIETLEYEGYIKSEDELKRGLRRRIVNRQNRRRIFGSMTVSPPPVEQEHSETTDTFEELPLGERVIPPGNVEGTVPNTFELIDEEGNLTINLDTYQTVYGSYSNFVDAINGITKSYYNIPQGVHLGHIFYIIKSIGDGSLDYRLSLYNQSTTGEHGTSVRQTNYKVAACMELMFLEDYRLPQNLNNPLFSLQLTNNGEILYHLLNEIVTDETFYNFATESPTTWKMEHNRVEYYIDFIKGLDNNALEILYSLFANLPIFNILVDFINQYHTNEIPISALYEDFWSYEPVIEYLDLLELTIPSQSSLEHRVPFLLSLLRGFSIVDINQENTATLTRL